MMDAADIAKQLNLEKSMNVKQSGLFQLMPMLASVIILPTIIALLSLIFIRNKKIMCKILKINCLSLFFS
jgi:hypothetical protein